MPDEFWVLAGDPVEPAVDGSRGSGVIAPVVAAAPGTIAGDPETVDPEPVAVGRSEPPPDAPDGGVETCASAAPVSAMMMMPAIPILMMIVSSADVAEMRGMRVVVSANASRAAGVPRPQIVELFSRR